MIFKIKMIWIFRLKIITFLYNNYIIYHIAIYRYNKENSNYRKYYYKKRYKVWIIRIKWYNNR